MLIKINLSKPITKWSTELNILLGWDNFKGVVKSDYKLVDTNIVFLILSIYLTPYFIYMRD